MVLGVILIVLALLPPLGLGILLWPGVILLIVGAVLMYRPVGGRRLW
jgi:hypothetical protein